ncbi:MAG: hypothetical protein RH982_17380 [Parvibaculum sp.]
MKMKSAAIVLAAGLMIAGCETTGAGGQAAVPGAYVPTPQEQAIQQAAIAQAGAAGAFNYNAAQAAAGGAIASQAAAGMVGQGVAAAALGGSADAPIAASQPDDAQKSCEQLAAEIEAMNGIVAEANSSATNAQVASVGLGIAQSIGGYFGMGAISALQAGQAAESVSKQQQGAAQARSQQAGIRLQVLGAISQGKGC